MNQVSWCEGCDQARDCKKVYERLGRTEGPPVALKAVLAFGLPVGVFVTALGLFGGLLQPLVAPQLRTLCASALAFCATAVSTLAVSRITKRLENKRC